MHFTKLMKTKFHTQTIESSSVMEEEVIQVENATDKQSITSDDPQQSQLVELLKELSKKNEAQMPNDLANCSRSQQDIDMLLGKLKEFEEKYFSEIPLSKKLSQSFVFNVPEGLIQAVHYMDIHDEIPDILNPAILFYMMLVEKPIESIGRYWEIIFNMLKENIDVINEDAQAYVADLSYDAIDDEEGIEVDDDEEQ